MLHVSLLGEQSITDDRPGGAAIRSSRTAALVGFLVVHAGKPQPRQRIAAAFWPDSTDAQALTNLRRELHNLRQAVPDCPSLSVTQRDLCWRDSDSCAVDVRIFAVEREAALAAAAAGDDRAAIGHAARAVGQYRGEFLPGIYDDWLLEVRSELERQCADLCDVLTTARARSGDLTGAAETARRRIQIQPLAEDGYRTLMRLQADLGDRAGAVSTYHHCASVLERELGVLPDPATQQIFQRLVSARAPARTEVARPGGVAEAQLVGRTAELALLSDRWRAARAGQPGIAVVRGGAGVGKSRLVSEVADTAGLQGAVVAASQCFGTPGRLALAPVADWLRAPAVRSAGAALDPVWRSEVGRLVPSGPFAEAGARPARSSGALADAWQRHRFFEGLARALLAVGRPTLLVLDNMQWCDQETLGFLVFLLSMSRDAQLLVAATLRDDDPGDTEVAEWTVRMRAAGQLFTDIRLSPLETADTARVAEAIAGRPVGPAEAGLLQATTGGFPLYVIEAMRGITSGPADDAVAEQPARDLSAVLGDRMSQASQAAREIAGLAAAVGTDFGLDLLTEASDLGADAVVAAVDELWRRRIVHEFRDGYDFSHDLLRDAAYALVSPPRRWLMHRRIAQSLELLHTGDTDPVAAQLAGQYARGGRPERALTYYRRAADIAASVFAHAEAVRLHGEALSIIRGMPAGRDRDTRELAVLEAMAAPLNARSGYSSAELEATLERTVGLARTLGLSTTEVSGMLSLWTTRFVQGRITDSYKIATQALALTEPESKLYGTAHFAIAGSAVSLGMPAEALGHFEVAARLAHDSFISVGTRPYLHGAAWSAHAHWLVGDDEAARASAERALGSARRSDPYNLAVTLGYRAVTSQLLGDLDSIADTVAELRALCDRHDFGYYREWGLIVGAWARAGSPAVSEAGQGIANLKAAGSLTRMPYWLSLLADLQERAGDRGAARASLDAAQSVGLARGDVWWLPEVMRMRAAYDSPAAAVARLRSAAQLAAQHGSTALVRRCEADLARHGIGCEPAGVPPGS